MKNTKAPTILFDANPLMVARTGVGYYIAQMVEQLARNHPETTFVGYYYNFLGRKAAPTHPRATNIHSRPIYHFPGPVINLLRRFGVEVPIELLVFKRSDFIWYPNYLTQPSLFKTPCAATIHDLTFVDLPDYVARKNLEDLTRFVPRQLKRQSFVTTVSEFTKQRLHEEFQVPPADVLVTPIAPPPVPVENSNELQLLRDLGISGKYILTLGTVEPRKNLPNMFDAYLQLPEELQREYTFVVAGKIGWNCDVEVDRLTEMKAGGKNVIHLGYVSDEQRNALYRHATLFTTASFYEGFGMPALEAMGYRIPCAISDIAVFREVASGAALYFNQDDASAIASAWQQLLTDPTLRQQLAEKGKQRADSYNWQRIANHLYGRILAATNIGATH
jgi:alpha-1,3-rhamnosyl/mannosyltransferase